MIRLKGPDYRIAKHLNPSLKDLTKGIVKIGKMYAAVEAFSETYTNPNYGQVNQALCANFRYLLKVFIKIIHFIIYITY